MLTTDTAGPGNLRLPATGSRQAYPAGYEVLFCRKVWGQDFAPGLLVSLPGLIRWADVVHLTGVYSWPTLPALLTCRLLRKPLIWSPRGSLQRWQGSSRLRLKAFWERACRAAAPHRVLLHYTSEKEARESRPILPWAKTAVIPNAVEIPEFAERTDGGGLLRLVYVGRLHPIKGIENLLAACSLLLQRGEDQWSLTLAGAGTAAFTQTLEEIVRKTSLSPRVRFAGMVSGEEKRRLFAAADVLVLPSHTENFGMAAAEALAHGVPVIAGQGTPWERLVEIGCGLWVPNNPESLARAIERIRRMPLEEMGLRGRAWMQKEFSWEERAREMIRCYQEATA